MIGRLYIYFVWWYWIYHIIKKILEKYYIQDVLYYTITYNNGYKLQDD